MPRMPVFVLHQVPSSRIAGDGPQHMRLPTEDPEPKEKASVKCFLGTAGGCQRITADRGQGT